MTPIHLKLFGRVVAYHSKLGVVPAIITAVHSVDGKGAACVNLRVLNDSEPSKGKAAKKGPPEHVTSVLQGHDLGQWCHPKHLPREAK